MAVGEGSGPGDSDKTEDRVPVGEVDSEDSGDWAASDIRVGVTPRKGRETHGGQDRSGQARIEGTGVEAAATGAKPSRASHLGGTRREQRLGGGGGRQDGTAGRSDGPEMR